MEHNSQGAEKAPQPSQELEDFKALMALPEGRRVLRTLLYYSNLLGPSYIDGESHRTAYNEGLRFMGMYIVDMARQADPENYLLLLQTKE